jgi:hypothetical protein
MSRKRQDISSMRVHIGHEEKLTLYTSIRDATTILRPLDEGGRKGKECGMRGGAPPLEGKAYLV